MVEFNPTHEVREGVDLVWQIPPNPKGVLFIAHSAGGSPFSFWPSHPNVPQCTGTPEHKVLTKDALKQGFAVLAGKSVDIEWHSWPLPTVDAENFKKILKDWPRDHGLEDLPLSGLGSSSGGTFMACLATQVKFHTIVLMISHGYHKALVTAVPGEYPATLFVPMTGDDTTMPKVKQSLEILKAKGIPAAIQEAPPLKVDPHFLAAYIDELDVEQATKLHSLFVDHGIVAEDNSLNKLLVNDEVEPYLRKAAILPTVDDLQRQQDEEKLKDAKKSKAEPISKEPEGSIFGAGPHIEFEGPTCHPLAKAVTNQLKVAQGNHTVTARHDKKIFAWLEGKGWPKVQHQ